MEIYDANEGVSLGYKNYTCRSEKSWRFLSCLGFKAGILGYSISEMKAHKK